MPALDLPGLLNEEASARSGVAGTGFSGAVGAGFRHYDWYIDPVHLGRKAHTLLAWLIWRAIERQGCAAWHDPDDAHPLQLPPPFRKTAGATSAMTRLDFTDERASLRQQLLSVDGSTWVQSSKQAGGGYDHDGRNGTALPARGGSGNLGFVSQRGGASFEAELNFSRGSLAIGYLQSYSSVGLANIVVLRSSSRKGGPVAALNRMPGGMRPSLFIPSHVPTQRLPHGTTTSSAPYSK